jgi:hypothetical protein
MPLGVALWGYLNSESLPLNHQEKAHPEACSSEETTMKTRSFSSILITTLFALAILHFGHRAGAASDCWW